MKIAGNKGGHRDKRWGGADRGAAGLGKWRAWRDGERRDGTSNKARRGAAGQNRMLLCKVGRGTRRNEQHGGMVHGGAAGQAAGRESGAGGRDQPCYR